LTIEILLSILMSFILLMHLGFPFLVLPLIKS
jgi:adenosine/AMP kinase